MRLQASLLALALGLFTIGSTSLHATPPPRSAMDRVALTAWLQVAEGSVHDVIVEVEVNGNSDWGRPNAEGRVELELPANEVAMIHFRKPGHLTKSVKVDTHNLNDGTFKGKRRSIDFGVELVAEKEHPGLAYAGPVASIAFHSGDGELLVDTNTHLVPANHRQQSIVF